jgi:hypothetical protein
MLMALAGGIYPFLRVIFKAPGTVLLMILSRSARFEMMNQPDTHPYKVLVRTAFDPTRGLFWRGVLLMVAFIPAAFVHAAASEFFRQRAANNMAEAPPMPGFQAPGMRPGAGGAAPGANPGNPAHPRQAIEEVLQSLPNYVADSLTIDEGARQIQFQHRGQLPVPVVGRTLAQRGFQGARIQVSTNPS